MKSEELVECSLCSKMVPISETCSTLACRACHISVTFEDCINHTTPDELAWEAKKKLIREQE